MLRFYALSKSIHNQGKFFHFQLYIMQYILLYQNLNDLICRQTIVEWKNLKAQYGFWYPHDNVI